MIKNPPRQGRFFTALLRRAASAAFDAGSPCVGRLESIKSKGAPAKSAILWGTPLRHGGSAKRRVRAGEVKMIKNPPRQGRVLRRFCAAPRVRRSTQGARVSGDWSLSNRKGPPQNQRFCGERLCGMGDPRRDGFALGR